MFEIGGGETSVAMMKHSMAKDRGGADCDALELAVFVKVVPLLEPVKELTRPAFSGDGGSLVVP